MNKESVLYLSSTAAIANEHLYYSRQHWGIENKLHWFLDVVFSEDRTRLGARNAAQNMAIIRKLVINMIKRYKQATKDETAIKTMRKVSSWYNKSAGEVLKFMMAN